MKEKEFFIEGRKISYLEWGNGSNVLFCVHGVTRNAHDFDYIAEFLQAEYRVIAINLAGHGSSTYLNDYTQYHYRFFLDDIFNLLDHLAIESVHWLGSSLGGIIGMYACHERPKLIKKLILNDIGPQIPMHSLSSLQNVNIDSIRPNFIFNSQEACRDRFMRMVAGFKFPSPEHLQHAWDMGFRKDALGNYFLNFDVGVLSLFANTDNVMRKAGIWHIWRAINIPILEMWGAISPLLNRELIKKMSEENPNLTVCKSLSNGHVCNLIDIEQLEFIQKWLRNYGPKMADVVVP